MRGASGARPSGEPTGKDLLADEISNLKREYERIIQCVSSPGVRPWRAQQIDLPQPNASHRLLEQELDAELANAIAAGADLEGPRSGRSGRPSSRRGFGYPERARPPHL